MVGLIGPFSVLRTSQESNPDTAKDGIQMRVKSTRSSEQKLLTKRQTEVFELALRRGYWDHQEEPR